MNEFDYGLIIKNLFPDALWGLVNNDYATLTWDESNADAMPSKEMLDAAWPQVQYERAYEEVRFARHAAYAAPDGPDAIFLQWQRGDAAEQDWLDAVQAVKDTHPYPPQPDA